MGKFTDKLKLHGLPASNRIRPVAPDARPPTPFEQVGGWADPSAGLHAEELPSEGDQRRAGRDALAELQRQQADRPGRAAAQVPEHARGRDYSRGLYE